jgi:hypothetical protein
MIPLSELHAPVVIIPDSPEKLNLEHIPEELELEAAMEETAEDQPDLLCHEVLEQVLPQLLDADKCRSTHLRAKELPTRETVAVVAVCIKKRKLDVVSAPISSHSSSSKASMDDTNVTISTVVAAAPATAPATSVSTAPAWRVGDLQLLGRACGDPDDRL